MCFQCIGYGCVYCDTLQHHNSASDGKSQVLKGCDFLSLLDEIFQASFTGDGYSPDISISKNYKHWISEDDDRRCVNCEKSHGRIWDIDEEPKENESPPLHPNCRCVIEIMKSIKAGTATKNGIDGADWTLKYDGELPGYYITMEDIYDLGWERGKHPNQYVADMIITGGTYQNRNHHLPHTPGRIWHEADINYEQGKRNSQRVVWSNDGLIFVTYDHYMTFHEII